MACEGNGQSDERIGVALIEQTFHGALTEVQGEDLPSLGVEPARLESQQERCVLDVLADMIRIVGETVEYDQRFQDAIDGFSRGPGSVSDKFSTVVNKVFADGKTTWERITVLFYVAGRLAIRVVETYTPQMVVDLLRCTVDYFKTTLLSWIQRHGGWVSGIAELSRAALRRVPPVNSQKFALLLVFVAGLSLGSFLTWRLARGP